MRQLFLLFAAIGPIASASHAQDYPSRPIRIIVPFGAGSATDLTARPLAKEITATTGIQFVVDNRPGAEGQLGAQAAATAKPDGYTILISTQTTQAANISVYKNLPYHPITSFTPITGIRRGPLIVLTRKDLGITSIKDLIARAKAEPGKFTFGSGNGSSRAGGEYFKLLAGIDMLHVPYKSQPQVMTDIAGGRLDLTFTDMYTGMPFFRDGRAPALAVTSNERLKITPGVPTVMEAGVPGYEMWAWTAVFAPAGTPRPIVDRLNQLFQAAINSAAFREVSEQTGGLLFPGTPEALGTFQRAEIERWAKIVTAAGMKEP